MDVVEKLFSDLESNNLEDVARAKLRLTESFSINKESWLVNGMMDYFSQTNSSRIVEILVKVQSPHDTFIFDRLAQWMHGTQKNLAITLFGHIVRNHPSWLYKVANHQLFKDFLRLLRSEPNIISIMSALYCIVILLPIIPTAMPQYLQDLFDIFLYLSTWNYNKVPRLTDDQLIHLQLGLSIFFQRLYGMFPCNFIAYLRDHVVKEHRLVFVHTIVPMLETVKMHPMLLTSNRDLEKNNTRWKEMEPHDVVVECSKFSLDNFGCTYRLKPTATFSAYSTTTTTTITATTDCLYNMLAFRHASDDAACVQPIRTTPNSSAGSLLRGAPSHHDPRQLHPQQQRIDNLWSPLLGVLATPPPSGAGLPPHTPTSSVPSLAVQTIPAIMQQQCASGASPPEAAVEATPETTPMKDSVQAVRSFPSNSTAVRAIWGLSQPSSPMKSDTAGGGSSAFRYADIPPSQIVSVEQHRPMTAAALLASPKIMNFVTERSMYANQVHALAEMGTVVTADTIFTTNTNSNPSATNVTTREDLEVTEINSLIADNGMQIPGAMENYAEHFQQWHSQVSRSLPAESVLAKRRLHQRNSRKTTNNNNNNNNHHNRSPYGEEAAAPPPEKEKNDNDEDDDVDLIEHRTGDESCANDPPLITMAPLLRSKRNNFAKRPNPSIGTQTIDQIPIASYDQILDELVNATVPPSQLQSSTRDAETLSPHTLLDQYIETSIGKRAPPNEPHGKLTEQIQLLNLLLQYERYRREVHAERNRRLLGKSRVNAGLEMDNERLGRERAALTKEVDELKASLNKVRIARNQQDRDTAKELAKVRLDHQHECEANQQLRTTIETMQRRVGEEKSGRRAAVAELEAARAELFDLRNELQQTQGQAEMGQHYKTEVHRLQSEVALMGEIQMKCKEKLSEIGNLKARDTEMDGVRHAYDEEVREMRQTMDVKSSQLDSAKARLIELEAQLLRRDSMFTDQKRLLKTVKEEYQDKFRALEEKYVAQKAIILRMEEELLELYTRNQAAVNPTHVSSDSDRADGADSLDHTSPLSISLASSEGLSLSLRSVTEIRNLQSLVGGAAASSDSQFGSTTATTTTVMTTGGSGGATGSGRLQFPLEIPGNVTGRPHHQQHHPPPHHQKK